MSRTPFTGLTPNPMFRRQTEEINRALRQSSELNNITSNDGTIRRGPNGTTIHVDRELPKDFWFYGVVVNNSPDSTYGDFADARYWVQSITPTQVGLASPTDTATFYTDGQFHVVAVNGGEALAATHSLPTTSVFATAGLPVTAGATLVKVRVIDASKLSASPGDWGNTIYVLEPLVADVPAGTRFEVAVTKTSGLAGDATTQCAFIYTAVSLAGVTLGTGLSPVWARPAVGKMVQATHGSGYMASGVFVLSEVDEVPAKVLRNCA